MQTYHKAARRSRRNEGTSAIFAKAPCGRIVSAREQLWSGTARYSLQGAEPLDHQRGATFASVAQGPRHRVAGPGVLVGPEGMRFFHRDVHAHALGAGIVQEEQVLEARRCFGQHEHMGDVQVIGPTRFRFRAPQLAVAAPTGPDYRARLVRLVKGRSVDLAGFSVGLFRARRPATKVPAGESALAQSPGQSLPTSPWGHSHDERCTFRVAGVVPAGLLPHAPAVRTAPEPDTSTTTPNHAAWHPSEPKTTSRIGFR